MTALRKVLAATALAALTLTWAAAAQVPASTNAKFDHAKHASFLSDCSTCHQIQDGVPTFPAPTFCASCHDGSMQPRVSYQGRTFSSRANLKFSHGTHPMVETCTTCHPSGGVRPVVATCLECHGITTPHQDPATPCTTCHVQPPAPASHTAGWRTEHRLEAAASPETCASCHVRSDCLACHRPSAAAPSGYHPTDYLARHSVDAYSRRTECSDCHNVGSFCQDCHRQAGMVASGNLRGGYHDANGSFLAGHGQAARQSLESCVTCHTERDCLQCHTRLNPHGPDFDAASWRKKAPEMCVACHGNNIPNAP